MKINQIKRQWLDTLVHINLLLSKNPSLRRLELTGPQTGRKIYWAGLCLRPHCDWSKMCSIIFLTILLATFTSFTVAKIPTVVSKLQCVAYHAFAMAQNTMHNYIFPQCNPCKIQYNSNQIRSVVIKFLLPYFPATCTESRSAVFGHCRTPSTPYSDTPPTTTAHVISRYPEVYAGYALYFLI